MSANRSKEAVRWNWAKLSANDPKQPLTKHDNEWLCRRVFSALMITTRQNSLITLLLLPFLASASDVRSAEWDIEEMRWSFERYYKTFGVYPDSFDELIDKYRNSRHPEDPWGRKYQYSLERPSICEKEMPYYLWTYGSDGKIGGEGTARDIANCNL